MIAHALLPLERCRLSGRPCGRSTEPERHERQGLCLFPLAVMLVLTVASVVAALVPLLGVIAVAGVSLAVAST